MAVLPKQPVIPPPKARQPEEAGPPPSVEVPPGEPRKWYYRTPEGTERGPLRPSEVLQRINRGEFDGRATTPFRSDEEREFRPLVSMLHRITQGQLAETYDRLRLRPVAPAEVVEEAMELPVEVAPEFDVPFDLSAIPAYRRPFVAIQNLPPDLDVVVLPPRGTVPSPSFPQVEAQTSDAHLAFSIWAEEHRIAGCKKALVFPVHSIVLKCASPVLLRAIEFRETEQRGEQELSAASRRRSGVYRPPSPKRRRQFLIRMTNPEVFRVILRYLYGFLNEFPSLEPVLLACVYFEACRLEMGPIAEEARAALSRITGLDALLAVAEATELLDLWNPFNEACEVLAGSIYVILSGQRYLHLGPVGLHRILSNSSASIDEIQLFIAGHLWLMRREDKFLKMGVDFWDVAKRASGTSSGETAAAATDRTLLYHSNRLFIFSAIRFCQLSPQQLREARIALRLDTLLLDGALRKLLHTEVPGRYRPWTENAYFETESDRGLFPLRVRRKRTRKRSVSWCWTAGDTRPVAEACWPIQVLVTQNGKISVGILSREAGKTLPNLGPTPTGNTVWYFNVHSREFYTGSTGTDPGALTSRFSMGHATSWPKRALQRREPVCDSRWGTSRCMFFLQRKQMICYSCKCPSA